MANEQNKDFNAMLRKDTGMPKIQEITDPRAIEKYGGARMYFAPPIDYDRVMRLVPEGMLTTVGEIRSCFARANHAEPLLAAGSRPRLSKTTASAGKTASGLPADLAQLYSTTCW